jgi:flagellar motor switch protein FliG
MRFQIYKYKVQNYVFQKEPAMTKFERILTEKRVSEFFVNAQTLDESTILDLLEKLDPKTIKMIQAILARSENDPKATSLVQLNPRLSNIDATIGLVR